MPLWYFVYQHTVVEAKSSLRCYLVLKNIPFAHTLEGRIWDFMVIDM